MDVVGTIPAEDSLRRQGTRPDRRHRLRRQRRRYRDRLQSKTNGNGVFLPISDPAPSAASAQGDRVERVLPPPVVSTPIHGRQRPRAARPMPPMPPMPLNKPVVLLPMTFRRPSERAFAPQTGSGARCPHGVHGAPHMARSPFRLLHASPSKHPAPRLRLRARTAGTDLPGETTLDPPQDRCRVLDCIAAGDRHRRRSSNPRRTLSPTVGRSSSCFRAIRRPHGHRFRIRTAWHPSLETSQRHRSGQHGGRRGRASRAGPAGGSPRGRSCYGRGTGRPASPDGPCSSPCCGTVTTAPPALSSRQRVA